ncbi:2'-5' RNA ligase family protein [Arenimonas oryziterrae]|uniref:Phosphoesterase HXTX domain-containing protein n=1 Tax=Arenimonas oryziterrae DSM 21050 = YC6267 TaxID=1121015 RepID=A0A091AWN3_9GAMM|nr:2'-5' RNA ligase family protein [Arenimonas oryziterrae]KFN43064.1 hypothetical protein N789_10910 [Arenimonas oryziterrae DSM 21050 = YC6267]
MALIEPNKVRLQLSLYLSPSQSAAVEALRAVLDPVQHRLIPAHVTLCREDELAALDLAALGAKFADADLPPLTLHFGRPEAFHEHGILLPCIDGEADFHQRRERILATSPVRHQAAHITLAHPRNPKAAGNHLDRALQLPQELCFTFTSVCLIRQQGASPWQVLETFAWAAPR